MSRRRAAGIRSLWKRRTIPGDGAMALNRGSPRRCLVVSCGNRAVAKDLCRRHYSRERRGQSLTDPDAIRVGQPDGHGRFGRIDVVDDLLMCHECGRTFAHLGLHAWRGHGISADSYRERHGLPRRAGLVGPSTHATIVANAVARMETPAGRAFADSRDPATATAARRAEHPRPSVSVTAAETGRANGRRGRRPRVITCPNCGATFCPLPGAYRRRFCSRSCASQSRRRRPK